MKTSRFKFQDTSTHLMSSAYRLGALISIFCVILSGECLAISVTSTNDSGVGSLRAAILAAAAGDTIQFDPSLNGKTINITSGALEISKPLTIQGPGAGQLTVDGTKNGDNNVFQIDAGIHNVQISGLTVIDSSQGFSSPIANNSGYLSVAGCTLSGGGATAWCGGIFFDPTSGGSLTVSNCDISNNAGSGVYIFGSAGTMVVPVTITGCRISNNTGAGGLYIYEFDTNIEMSVQSCVISGNSGDGIFSVGMLAVTGSTISGNGGGGIYNGYPGTATLINSTVWGNDGGGVSSDGGNTLTLDNCTVSQNTSSSSGGGISSHTGGILGGTVTLNNTIVAYNSGNSGVDIAGSVTANYCLIGDPTGATISSTATNLIGTHAAPLDPKIAWLGGTYGGPTMPDGTTMLTAPPLAGSPAIDAGSNALIPSGVTTDQRGLPRIVNGTVDIGACEYQPVVMSISVTLQSNPSGRSFTVDGTTYTAAQTFSWVSGSGHTIATTSPQSGGAGIQYVWSSWSDGGTISHTVAPTSGTNYTANFTTEYFLTVNMGTGGSSVSPASGWYNSGATVGISATTAGGYSFSSWTGTGTGSYSGSSQSSSVTMNGPITETASFATTSCTYALSMTSTNVVANGGSGSFSVMVGGSCSWSASSDATSWLQASGSGPGNGTVSYTYSANTTTSSRTGHITVQTQTFTVTQAGVSVAKIFGVDVSACQQKTIDWTQVKQASVSDGGQSYPITFACIRASKGTADLDNCEFKDPQFSTFAQSAGNAGIVVGAYHVAAITNETTGDYYSPVSEADFFVGVAGKWIKAGNMRPFLDLEDDPSGSGCAPHRSTYVGLTTWVDQWMQEVQSLTGVTPIIYCNTTFAGLLQSLAPKYDLWIAKPGTDPGASPEMAPWNVALIQYDWFGSVRGMQGQTVCPGCCNTSSYVDMDVFQGTSQDFQSKLTIGTLSIAKLQGTLNFAKTNADSCTVKGTFSLPVSYSFAGKLVTLDIGGTNVSFVLDSKGKWHNGLSTFSKPTYNKSHTNWTFNATLKNGSWQTPWAEYGMVNTNTPKQGILVTNFPVTLVVDTEAFMGTTNLQYTAKHGKSGTAKLKQR